MPLMFGFGALGKLPWERVNDKIQRRVLAGKHGMIVWWKIAAGAHAVRINIRTSRSFGCSRARWNSASATSGIRWSPAMLQSFPATQSTKVFSPKIPRSWISFAPPREDFLAGGTPSYMRAP